MANIFKKIKTIDIKADVNNDDKPDPNTPEKPVRLGIKPVMKISNDADVTAEDITAKDFIDPFGKDTKDDLAIPNKTQQDDNTPPLTESANAETEEPAKDTSMENEPPNLTLNDKSQDAVDIPKLLGSQDHIDTPTPTPTNKPLNLHPVEEIEAIAPVTDDSPTHQTIENAELSFPNIITGTPSPSLDIPHFSAPKWPYIVLTFMAFLWILGSAAAAYGYFELGLTALTANPVHAMAFVGFVLIPACLLLLTALLIRRMNSLSVESQKLAFLNQQLLTPSDHSEKAAARLSDAISTQMDRIEQRADQAFNRLKIVQDAFAVQIDDVSNTLTTAAERQSTLDANLISSKASWTDSLSHTEQALTAMSSTLETTLSRFIAQIEDAQTNIDQVGKALKAQASDSDALLSPLLDRSEKMKAKLLQHTDTVSPKFEALDNIISAHENKLSTIRTQHEALKTESMDLHSSWADADEKTQDRIFAQLSHIDALTEKTDVLIEKMNRASDGLKPASDKPNTLPLRGRHNEEQLSLIPGLGDAKTLLPSLLSHEDMTAIDNPTLTLDYEDIAETDLHDKMLTLPPETSHDLSAQRVIKPENKSKKSAWFKPFGRRQKHDEGQKSDSIKTEQLTTATPQIPLADPSMIKTALVQRPELSLQDTLIREQLSPDALIDMGCVHRAAQIRLEDGPFAMSRYVSTHLGAAAQHLKSLLPDNPTLRRQVHDMAASFPIREQLDMRSSDELEYILGTQSGREYLICDAALNG